MVARIVFLRRKKLPLRMIVSIMNQDDVREKTGRTYSLRTVQNICQRWSKGTRSWFAGIKDVSMIVPNIENPPWMREGVMPCI
jgi:hypothetical protein